MLNLVSAYKKGISVIQGRKENAFFTISPCYPFFQDINLEKYTEEYLKNKKLDEYIAWSKKNLKKLCIFISDILLHYNIMAFEGKEKDNAVFEAEKANKIFMDCLLPLLKPSSKLELILLSNLSEDQEFNTVLYETRVYSAVNTVFQSECTRLTISGTKNKLAYIKQIHGYKQSRKALDIAKKYAIDEVAAMLYLYKKFPVSISKYELPSILKSITNNRYPEFFSALKINKSIGHIQLVPKGENLHREYYDDKFERLVKNDIA